MITGKNKIKNKVAVIMCTWQRFYWLEQTLDLLDSQTFKDFDFYIFNNNPKMRNAFSEIDFSRYFYDTRVIHSQQNIGGIGRFKIANDVYSDYEKIVFIDDDQFFGPKFLQSLYDKHTSGSILGWWAWKFISDSYFERTRITDLCECDYIGTGGMICDSLLFKKSDLLNIPTEYSFIEDLWLCFYAKYEMGYKLLGDNFDIYLLLDEHDQYHKLRKKKEQFLKYLMTQYV